MALCMGLVSKGAEWMPFRKAWGLVTRLGEDDQASASTAESSADAADTSRESGDTTGPQEMGEWQVELVGDVVAADSGAEPSIRDETGVPPKRFFALLVRYHGGRCWQGQLVDAAEWSAATVSRHLAELESDGTIERVKIGREKLVCTPGHRPDTLEDDSER